MKNILKASALAITLSFTTAITSTIPTAFAQPANQLVNQAPGYYHQMLGDFMVTAIYDGYIYLSPSLLKGIENKDIQTLLARMFQIEEKDGVQTAINAYLVNTKEGLVLIDTGGGKCFGPTMGNIVDNIRAAGYTPEAVKTILLTHMHPDHICGLSSANGKTAFPNATVYAAQEEKDFWLNPEIAASAPKESRSMFKMAQDAIAPYIAKKAFHTFKSGDNVTPGIEIISTFGHTPGHTSFKLHSGNNSMLIWGDIVHSHSVQFTRPEVSIEFDVDNAKAVEARKYIFEKASQEKWLISAAHLPFPGIGHIRKDEQGYSWVPVEYSGMLKAEN
ncbi:MBL fold metallo-hydrolase [Xenorhabdus doucetiae]|uniref:Glyoxylase-like metal-dependent hydrolase (Beta-lactamase superfamily II) n=1 Tax=Xenorhabdus doucetiae TaxID=351671 RepID=A0A068QPG8_9GAMM|nr:MBL fold metallo-hydrolase [Xenorhabdus doucetiae]TYP00378.1 glyoxylase-like metal-dependent hydrolase (beta-lactamase superfamily II) [Xenorhabdus doucetiae]CDG16679.1 Zn-dependent hydrolases, including glyoxylases [Xenorhabdus doucetiae]